MAKVAETKSKAHSKRIKEGLAAARARGKVLGGYRGGPKVDSARGTEAARKTADMFAAGLAPTLRPWRDEGCSLADIAWRLNGWKIATRQGKEWTATAVKNVLARLARLEDAEVKDKPNDDEEAEVKDKLDDNPNYGSWA